MNKNPIQVMLDEHEMISSAEQTIHLLNHFWEKDAAQFVKYVRALITFFREYSDKYHHYKEEQVLFPELEEHSDFTLHSMIDELKEHHDIFREYLQHMETCLHNMEHEKAYNILARFMNDLLDHIAIENDELFVIVESLLSKDELDSMYFKFRDIDAALGEARKSQLCETLTDITKAVGQIDL